MDKIKKYKKFYIIAFVALELFCFISGIMGLLAGAENIETAFTGNLKKGNVYEGEIKYCSSCVFEYYHLLYIIPIGTEYYYIAFSDNLSGAVVIRAEKNFDENFDEDTGKALSEIHVKGKVKKIPRKIKSHFTDLSAKLLFSPFRANLDTYYIDCLSNRIYVFRIIAGIGLLISVGILVPFFKKAPTMYPGYKYSQYSKKIKISNNLACIVLIISVILLLYSTIMS